MKRLLALLAWDALCLCPGALLPKRTVAYHDAARHAAFLARRSGTDSSGVQPWLYNPPPAPLPRSKPMEMPGGPLVLPPVDNMWGMQPSQSPPTIEPPLKQGDVGLQATVPPQGLDGWYATIPPQMIADGLVDNRTAYYVRCLGGPNPCPYTVPPTVLRYWLPVSAAALANAEASTTLADDIEAGATVLTITAPLGFIVGREVLIDAGTPLQESNYIGGFGSLILKFPCKYHHIKGVLITMPRPPPTTPFPYTMPPFRPWMNFRPMFHAFWPGPAPGPSPYPFSMPYPGPSPFPAPAPSPFLPMFSLGGPSPGPGGPAGAPGPAPAPMR